MGLCQSNKNKNGDSEIDNPTPMGDQSNVEKRNTYQGDNEIQNDNVQNNNGQSLNPGNPSKP